MFKNSISLLFFILVCSAIIGCKNDALPKPKSYLSLNYPKAKYGTFNSGCGYSFSYNTMATIDLKNNCNFDIHYKNMKATVYLNYKPVNNNIKILLGDAQRLTYGKRRFAIPILRHR